MFLLLKYWLRYILTLCLLAAIVFMVACTVLVMVFTADGGIKIRRVERNKKKK